MRHVLAAFVMFLLFAPASAEAAALDWIKELSGPGPSHGGSWTIGTLCSFKLSFKGSPDTQSAANTTQGWSKRPCLFIDRRSVENKDDDNFPNKVRIESWDFGLTWKRNKGGLELGAGVGIMRFHSDDLINKSGEMTRTKFTLTLGRGVAAPIRLLWPNNEGWKGGKYARIFKVYGRVNMITGDIDPTDFGVRVGGGPDESFWVGARNDLVPSGGILIDLGELFFR